MRRSFFKDTIYFDTIAGDEPGIHACLYFVDIGNVSGMKAGKAARANRREEGAGAMGLAMVSGCLPAAILEITPPPVTAYRRYPIHDRSEAG